MNRYILLFRFLLLIILFSSNNSFAQWGPDVRLTDDSVYSFISSNAQCLAAKGDTIHLVWFDNRFVDNEVFYMRSTDAGLSWGQDTMLSAFGNVSFQPALTTSGSNVHLVYEDTRDGNREIYCKSSTDGGTSWLNDKRLSNDPAFSLNPSVAAWESNVHVAFEDFRDANNGAEIYYRRSMNRGDFWNINLRLTNSNGESALPSICAFESAIHVAWEDDRDGNKEIYYKHSLTNGSNWGTDTRLTVNSATSSNPSIAVIGSDIHIVWMDQRDSNNELYYKRSTDHGLSWSADLRLTNTTTPTLYPCLVTSDSVINIFWFDSPGINTPDIYSKRSVDNGETWSETFTVTYDSSSKQYLSATASGSALYIAWQDYRDNKWGEIYFKRNPTGEPTDVEIINDEIPNEYILFQNYPNPFNPSTKIKFKIPGQARNDNALVTLKVYDILGREIATLVDEEKSAGSYEISFDGKKLPSGIYFYQLTSGSFRDSKKMLLIK